MAIAEIVAQTEKMRQANTRQQEAALAVLRSAANLAQAIFAQPADEVEQERHLQQVHKALNKLERALW